MKTIANTFLCLVLASGFALAQQQSANSAHKNPSTTAASPQPTSYADSFAGKWEIPEDSTGRPSCADFTATRLTQDRYKVSYGWCSDEMEHGTLQLIGGRLVGNVVDNMTKAVSKCEIAFLDDKVSISVKTIWPKQDPSVDILKRVKAASQPGKVFPANPFVGTWKKVPKDGMQMLSDVLVIESAGNGALRVREKEVMDNTEFRKVAYSNGTIKGTLYMAVDSEWTTPFVIKQTGQNTITYKDERGEESFEKQ